MENKKFAKKSDIIIIGIVVLVALAGLLYIQIAKKNSVKDEYNYVAFQVGSDVKELFYLGDYGEESVIIDLKGKGYPVSAQLELKDHKARFINVTCPDHICESVGWIGDNFEGAVCIPNQMSIVVLTPQEVEKRELLQYMSK